MSSRANIQQPALRGSAAAAALLAVAFWPWNLDTFAHNNVGAANKNFIPSPIILSVSTAASSRYVRIAMKDPEDMLEDDLEDALDDLEDALDDLEDALDDELDEDHSGSGDGEFDDGFDDGLDEDSSGHGGDEYDDEDSSGHGGDEDDDEDSSGHGGDEDDDEEDSSGHGGDEDDEEDSSGSNSGSDDDDEDDDDRSGRHGGRDDDDDDRSGSNSGSGHDDDSDYDEITDDDGFLVADRELLILVERSDLESGSFAEVDTEIEYDLPALGLVMLRVRVSEDDDMFERLSELEASLGENAVDLNHSYATDAASPEEEALAALLAVPVRLAGPLRLAEPLRLAGPHRLAGPLGLLPAGTEDLRIGIIDSGIDMSHRALSSAAIKTRNFANRGGPLSNAHGTMIAAIISGFEPGAYQGIAPGSEILAANIFFARADGTPVANVEGMILALDWLVGENVTVVNMSVSGPPNRLLRRAIERAAAAGTIIVAAVGNAGPASPPLYPAAYGSVVAVTAIDSGGQIYRLAVRGDHVEFAAPGVDVFAVSVADTGAGVDAGGYQLQSGTSLAVPFVAVALAAVRQQDQRPWADILSALHAEAQDLGEAGFDPVFGYGLIHGIGAASQPLYGPAGK